MLEMDMHCLWQGKLLQGQDLNKAETDDLVALMNRAWARIRQEEQDSMDLVSASPVSKAGLDNWKSDQGMTVLFLLYGGQSDDGRCTSRYEGCTTDVARAAAHYAEIAHETYSTGYVMKVTDTSFERWKP